MARMLSQLPLPLLPAGAAEIAPGVGLLAGEDDGLVAVHGLATFAWDAGDEAGRRLAAVQLARLRAASQGQVAEAFGVDPATIWRWDQAVAAGGVAGLVPARRGPKGASKLTPALAARIAELDADGQTLRQIAAATGVSTFTVRSALGRVGPGGQAPAASGGAGQGSVPEQPDGERAAAGGPLPVLPDPVRRDGERVLARWGLLGESLLTWRKGPAPDVQADEFTTITCADDRGREHHYDLADTMITLTISQGPRKGQTVSLRQVTRRVPARGGGTRQIHALTSRTGLAAGEVCWRLTSRWREENYFRYARTHFALDALDSHAATPDDPGRLVPNPARKAAAAQVRHAEILAAAAQAQRDASLAALRNPPPGQAVTITNQMINALDAPAEAAWAELHAAQDAAAAVSARIRLARSPRTWPGWTPRSSRSPTPSGWPPITPKPPWPAPWTATTPAPATKPTPSSAKPSPAPATSSPATANCSSASTRSPPPGAPRPWPPSATSSPKPRPATRAPISPCATRSNPPGHCVKYLSMWSYVES